MATSQILINDVNSSDSKYVFSNILKCDITDHLPTLTMTANVKCKHPPQEAYFKCNMKNFNLDQFLQQLNNSQSIEPAFVQSS